MVRVNYITIYGQYQISVLVQDIGEDTELLKLPRRCPVPRGLAGANGAAGVLPPLEIGIVLLDRRMALVSKGHSFSRVPEKPCRQWAAGPALFFPAHKRKSAKRCQFPGAGESGGRRYISVRIRRVEMPMRTARRIELRYSLPGRRLNARRTRANARRPARL